MYAPNRQRSRRLRKKLHLGEFQEMGFEFEAELEAPTQLEVQESLVDAFLSEVVEPRSLTFGGWITGGFVTSYGPGSVSEQDREAIHEWLARRPELKNFHVGSLVDAWYPPSQN